MSAKNQPDIHFADNPLVVSILQKDMSFKHKSFAAF